MSCEKPSGVLAVSGWAVAMAACWVAYLMYADYKEANERQTAAYLEAVKLMSEVKSELRGVREKLDQLDGWHKAEYQRH